MIDPNVLVSAAITPAGATAAVTDLIDAGDVVPVVSLRLLAELDGVLRREKFRTYLTIEDVDLYLSELARQAEHHSDPKRPPSESPDPDDDYLIALARVADADALVSGDPDLTGLDLADVLVLTPRQLLQAHTPHPDDPTE